MRNTVASSSKGPTTLKNIKNVPFGARGRKRKTLNVIYIGLQPNPDGRNLVVPDRSDDSVVTPATPGRRTYARAMSTPLHLPSTAGVASASSEPVNDLNIASVEETDTTFEFDSIVEGSDVGILHYSSSE